jgi:hypothetical protein
MYKTFSDYEGLYINISGFTLRSSLRSVLGLTARLPLSRRLLHVRMKRANAAPARLRRDGKRAFGNLQLGHGGC